MDITFQDLERMAISLNRTFISLVNELLLDPSFQSAVYACLLKHWNLETASSETILIRAVQEGFLSIMNIIETHDLNLSVDDYTLIGSQASETGNSNIIHGLFTQSVPFRPIDYCTMLKIAINAGHADIVWMIFHEYHQYTDDDYFMFMCMAISCYRYDLLRIILEFNYHSSSPLQLHHYVHVINLSVQLGNDRLIRYLLTHLLSIQHFIPSPNAWCQYAIHRNDLDMISELLNHLLYGNTSHHHLQSIQFENIKRWATNRSYIHIVDQCNQLQHVGPAGWCRLL